MFARVKMKRQQEQALLQQGFTDLPLELQGKIFADSFSQMIKTKREMDLFISLLLVSTSANDLVWRFSFDLITKIEPLVLANMRRYIIFKFRNLVEITCYSSTIFTESFGYFKNLESLTIAGYLMSENKISNLVQLKKLDVIKVTDADIKELTNLTELSLSLSSSVSDDGLSRLINLTKLSLKDSPHKGFFEITPKCIANLPKLCSLFIETGIFWSNGSLLPTRLSELECHNVHNQLLDSELKLLTNLCVLRLHGPTKISDDSFTKLIGLHTLSLKGEHKISCDGLGGMTNLTRLSLEYPKLRGGKERREAIGNLTNLHRLTLGDCILMSDTILCKLSNLTKLTLRGGLDLSYVGFSSLINLRHINLRKYKYLTLDDLSRCTNLQSIKENNGRRYWLNRKWNG